MVKSVGTPSEVGGKEAFDFSEQEDARFPPHVGECVPGTVQHLVVDVFARRAQGRHHAVGLITDHPNVVGPLNDQKRTADFVRVIEGRAILDFSKLIRVGRVADVFAIPVRPARPVNGHFF